MQIDIDTIVNLATILIAVISSYAVMKNELKHAKEDVANIYRLIENIQNQSVTERDLVHIDKRLEKIDNHLQILLEEKITNNPCKTCSKT